MADNERPRYIYCDDPLVKNWAEGRSHQLPDFNRDQQRIEATKVRRRTIVFLESCNNGAALMRFPEWRWINWYTATQPDFSTPNWLETATLKREGLRRGMKDLVDSKIPTE